VKAVERAAQDRPTERTTVRYVYGGFGIEPPDDPPPDDPPEDP
jgi:hypothetical protein